MGRSTASTVDEFKGMWQNRGVQTFLRCTELAASKTLGIPRELSISAKPEKSAITLQFNTVAIFRTANYGHCCSASQERARKDA